MFDFLKRLRNREKNPDGSTTGITSWVGVTTESVAVFVDVFDGLTIGIPSSEFSPPLLVGVVTSGVGGGVDGQMDVPTSTADAPFGQMTGLPLGN
jgi:hypothetical protein